RLQSDSESGNERDQAYRGNDATSRNQTAHHTVRLSNQTWLVNSTCRGDWIIFDCQLSLSSGPSFSNEMVSRPSRPPRRRLCRAISRSGQGRYHPEHVLPPKGSSRETVRPALARTLHALAGFVSSSAQPARFQPGRRERSLGAAHRWQTARR